jgi:molybdopterin-guanine dinucleotide biosynthesis protein A
MPITTRDGCEPLSDPVPAYILAGGRSRRFGSDKARALIAGVPLITRVAEAISRAALPVTVVAARQDAYSDLGLRTIPDIVPGQGPLGGLWTALAHHGGEGWTFVCACDWLGIRPEWIALLLAKRRPGAQAVLLATEPAQPLFGLYHASVRDLTEQRVRKGRLAMADFLRAIDVMTIPAPEDWPHAVNLNRPSDLTQPGDRV